MDPVDTCNVSNLVLYRRGNFSINAIYVIFTAQCNRHLPCAYSRHNERNTRLGFADAPGEEVTARNGEPPLQSASGR